MAGFDAKSKDWFLADAISDTAFRGFGQQDKKFYAYIGKINSLDDTPMYLEDLQVSVYRTEKQAKEMQDELAAKTLQLDKEETVAEQSERQESEPTSVFLRRRDLTRSSIRSLRERIPDLERRLSIMSIIYIAFIVAQELDIAEFLKSASSIISDVDRYRLTCSHEGRLEFGDISVNITTIQH